MTSCRIGRFDGFWPIVASAADGKGSAVAFEGKNIVEGSFTNENSIIIEPCFIGDKVMIKNSVVGPHVSIGNNTTIENSVIDNTIIQNETVVRKGIITNSMIGNKVSFEGNAQDLSIGDYTEYKG